MDICLSRVCGARFAITVGVGFLAEGHFAQLSCFGMLKGQYPNSSAPRGAGSPSTGTTAARDPGDGRVRVKSSARAGGPLAGVTPVCGAA